VLMDVLYIESCAISKVGFTATMPEKVLQTKDWVWLVVVVAGASVGNMGALHQISSSMRSELYELDKRWQERSAQMQKDLRQDIATLQSSIPPDWFRAMVETNQRKLESLSKELDRFEKEFTRDFVRKDELK